MPCQEQAASNLLVSQLKSFAFEEVTFGKAYGYFLLCGGAAGLAVLKVTSPSST